jgi:hypothetical protein
MLLLNAVTALFSLGAMAAVSLPRGHANLSRPPSPLVL